MNEPPWCATAHGTTTHPDDEDHRSVGVPLVLRARTSGSRDRPHDADAEVGLLRHHGDDETWLVIEDGQDVKLEITVDSARELIRAILDDPVLGPALGL